MRLEVEVVILAADPFTRHWISLLVARDRRTRLMAEAAQPAGLPKLFEQLDKDKRHSHLLLLDLDSLGGIDDITQILRACRSLERSPRVMFFSRQVDPTLLDRRYHPLLSGYILKGEIRHLLSWAVFLSAQNEGWVTTPGVDGQDGRPGVHLPRPRLVLDGREPVVQLTEAMERVARFAIHYGLERKDTANELLLSQGWVYVSISELYEAVGLRPNGENRPISLESLDGYRYLPGEFRRLLQQADTARKLPESEALAYHILTMPWIERVD